MRRISSFVMLAAASSLAAAGVHAQDDDVIQSDEEGALLPPEEWRCDQYVGEYREYLEDGGAAQDWRFVGKRYQSVDTGEFYDWQQWLEWEEDSDCAGAPPGPGPGSGQAAQNASGGNFFGDNMTAVGIVGGLLGVGAIAAGGGGGETGSNERNKSPG